MPHFKVHLYCKTHCIAPSRTPSYHIKLNCHITELLHIKFKHPWIVLQPMYQNTYQTSLITEMPTPRVKRLQIFTNCQEYEWGFTCRKNEKWLKQNLCMKYKFMNKLDMWVSKWRVPSLETALHKVRKLNVSSHSNLVSTKMSLDYCCPLRILRTLNRLQLELHLSYERLGHAERLDRMAQVQWLSTFLEVMNATSLYARSLNPLLMKNIYIYIFF